ncbi:MAG: hypothetical protein R3E66_15840 [bacterium]
MALHTTSRIIFARFSLISSSFPQVGDGVSRHSRYPFHDPQKFSTALKYKGFGGLMFLDDAHVHSYIAAKWDEFP